jgi:ferredoxin
VALDSDLTAGNINHQSARGVTMALRKIIEIDEEKCDGCGQCVTACAEGAIQLIDGKARLVSESYCDGLGACLGECPQGAIRIVERQAADFDQAAVENHLAVQSRNQPQLLSLASHSSCPGSAMRQFAPQPRVETAIAGSTPTQSQLGQWPVQLMLVPPHAPFLRGSDLLICADCVPFALADFHTRYLSGRTVVVGCPKLDNLEHYFAKLQQIFITAQPRRITVVKMEVPCCGGLAQAAIAARNQAAPHIPLEVHTVNIQGGTIVIETSLETTGAKLSR